MTRIKNFLTGMAFTLAIGAAFAFSSGDTTMAYAFKVYATGQCYSGLPASMVPHGCTTIPYLWACAITTQQGASAVFIDQKNGGTGCDQLLYEPW